MGSFLVIAFLMYSNTFVYADTLNVTAEVDSTGGATGTTGGTTGSGSSGGGGGTGYYPIPNTETHVIFSGHTNPFSIVTILQDGQQVLSTTASADGSFQITLPGLTTGNYIFSIRATSPNGTTSTLQTIPVYITSGATTTVSGISLDVTTDITDESTCRTADANCDDVVDLIDFSILAFWYKKVGAPDKIDLNHDGKINLIDFSIMAYYWTG